MHRTATIAGLTLAFLLPSTALAQDDDFSDWTDVIDVRLRDGSTTVEARLHSGQVTVSSDDPPASVTTTLVGERLRLLRQRFDQAEREDFLIDPTGLEVEYDDDGEPFYMRPASTHVRPLVALLGELAEALQSRPKGFPLVTLARGVAAGHGYASLGFDDGARARLFYTLDDQRHALGEHPLSFQQRWLLRRELWRIERLHAREPGDEPLVAQGLEDDADDWVLRLFTPSRTFSYPATGITRVPAPTVGMAIRLRALLDPHTVVERTCLGRVMQGRVVSGALTLTAQAALREVLAGLEGQQVVVQAAVADSASTGAALYLIADSYGEILPVVGFGADRETVLTLPDGISPRNLDVPSAQDGSLDWPLSSVELTWSTADAVELLGESILPASVPAAVASPLEGMVGALGQE